MNIELDHRRNELVALQLVAMVVALGLALIAAVAGIFGMNLANRAEDSYAAFVIAATGSSAACVAVIALFLGYAQHRGLLYIPDPQVLKAE